MEMMDSATTKIIFAEIDKIREDSKLKTDAITAVLDQTIVELAALKKSHRLLVESKMVTTTKTRESNNNSNNNNTVASRNDAALLKEITSLRARVAELEDQVSSKEDRDLMQQEELSCALECDKDQINQKVNSQYLHISQIVKYESQKLEQVAELHNGLASQVQVLSSQLCTVTEDLNSKIAQTVLLEEALRNGAILRGEQIDLQAAQFKTHFEVLKKTLMEKIAKLEENFSQRILTSSQKTREESARCKALGRNELEVVRKAQVDANDNILKTSKEISALKSKVTTSISAIRLLASELSSAKVKLSDYLYKQQLEEWKIDDDSDPALHSNSSAAEFFDKTSNMMMMMSKSQTPSPPLLKNAIEEILGCASPPLSI